MAIETILTVRKKDLSDLKPEQGVDVFRNLLWAEASVSGMPKSSVNVPASIYNPDGGVDAEVVGATVNSVQGVIKKGLTCYQVKTGKSDLSNDTQIKKILFKEDNKGQKTQKRILKPEVKRCIESKGTFVVVHFGWDGSTAEVKQIVGKFKKLLLAVSNKYKSANVEVFQQNKLCGFLGQYPSLALRLNNKSAEPFQTHKSWSLQAEMRRPFVSGSDHAAKIETIQKQLRKASEPVHIHVVGEPGIGKTRLVIEATNEKDLKPLVLYCEEGAKVSSSPLLNELLRDDNTCHVILVVDECDDQNRAKLWDKLQSRSPRIKLISIYNESKEISGITFLESPQLAKEDVSAIIQRYGVPEHEAGRWAELCSGSPRVAHVIGENLKNNPDDMLKSPSTVEVWDRFVAAEDPPDSPKAAERRVVLEHIALFKRFGYGQPVTEEAKAISGIIKKADPQVTWTKFQQIVSDLKNRKLLQGSATLYITPKLLHVKLWADWWEKYGDNFDIDEFSSELPAKSKLLDWFLEMFEYARESFPASRLAKKLLGPEGPFTSIEIFKAKRAAFFFGALVAASPEDALGCLQRTVGACSKERLLTFTEGRREIIYALEHIVIYKEMFVDAARLLLRLAEAENETWGNNASGVFAELFSMGYGRVAPTSASPQERLPILLEAFQSNSPEIRNLAFDACEKALKAGHFSRFEGHEYAGLKKAPEGWMPKTYAEWWEGYREIWKLLRERLSTFDKTDRQRAASIMLGSTRGLIRSTDLGSIVIDTLEEIVANSYADKKAVIKTLIHVLHYDGKELPGDIRSRIEQFKDGLEGSDFSSQLKRHVGMDLLEDDYDEDGNSGDLRQQRVQALASQAIVDKERLKPELEWLVTTEAQNGLLFGHELGLADAGFSLLPELLKAQRHAVKDPSAFFLCGYFRALREKDSERWESELDQLAEDPKLGASVPELTWRSGPLSDKAALRVLSLVENGSIRYEHLRMFSYGSAIRDLSEEVFRKWVELLLQKGESSAIAIALDLYHFFYCRKESKHELPEELSLRLLTHPNLFTKSEKRRETMEDYHWSATGQWFVKKYPQRSLEIAENMLKHFGEDGTIVDNHYGSPIEVLNAIIKKYPEQVWDSIKKYLGPPLDTRAFHINHWLRGGDFSKEKAGILPLIPLNKLWQWVDEDVPKRARHLARMVPNVLFREEGRICLAREVLVRHGDRDDVKKELMANFSTEGWSGPESSHLKGKKQELLEFKKGETNKNVRRWIDEYVASLDKSIQRAEIAEERDEF